MRTGLTKKQKNTAIYFDEHSNRTPIKSKIAIIDYNITEVYIDK